MTKIDLIIMAFLALYTFRSARKGLLNMIIETSILGFGFFIAYAYSDAFSTKLQSYISFIPVHMIKTSLFTTIIISSLFVTKLFKTMLLWVGLLKKEVSGLSFFGASLGLIKGFLLVFVAIIMISQYSDTLFSESQFYKKMSHYFESVMPNASNKNALDSLKQLKSFQKKNLETQKKVLQNQDVSTQNQDASTQNQQDMLKKVRDALKSNNTKQLKKIKKQLAD